MKTFFYTCRVKPTEMTARRIKRRRHRRKPNPWWLDLMDQVVNRENLIRALKRVRANKGSPGVDGMSIDDLTGYL